jgi:hypothetical protein
VPTTLYGDVSVPLDGKVYIVRVGNLEFFKLQEAYGVEGVLQCVAAAGQSTKNAIALYRIALSRNHPELTDEQVCNLMDFTPTDGLSLAAAVDEAIRFSIPELKAKPEGDGPKAEPRQRKPRRASKP